MDIWEYREEFGESPKMKRCSQCIMPESIPGITFSKEGVCNFCTDYQPQNYFGHEALDELLSTIRNNKNR